MSRKQYISPAIIHRLPRYYRYLSIIEKEGISKISSKDLADIMGLTSSQIRQDLNSFGGFGQQGYGYNISELKNEISSIIGLNNHFKAIIIGVGNLGKSVANYMDKAENGFEIVACFDKSDDLVGTGLLNLKVQSINNLVNFCTENRIDSAILCIPSEEAKQTVKALYDIGIKSFCNFSSYDISLDYRDIQVENIHLRDSLMSLCYKIADERI